MSKCICFTTDLGSNPHLPTIMDPPPSSSNHPDSSATSSPHSRCTDTTWDDNPLPPVPGAAKLRLMCSYGGHIIPRPHDKSLCYVGGDTRIVVVERHSSLAELHSRLSHTLLNGRHFTLKYQLPTEDLDSLISLSSDEDLDNMIEEYDRTTSASPLKPSRLRLFLFPSKPETAASMGSLLDDAKSETWFVDALNGAGLLPRGISESAAIDTFLERHHGNSDSSADLEALQNESVGNINKQVVGKANNNSQEVFLVETTSSFGSSSSSPSMANLPPIKVRTEGYNQTAGLDEQFSHASIASGLANAAPPPLPNIGAAASGGGENVNRVICDDEKSEKSDHGTVAATRVRKPPLPLQTVQRKVADIHSLTSPDSVTSESSITSVGSQSKQQTIHQEPVHRVPTPTLITTTDDQKTINTTTITTTTATATAAAADYIQEPITTTHDQILMQQLPYQNQQINIHQTAQPTHYIHHPQPMPVSSYYPMYQLQQHPTQTHQSIHHHQQIHDPQYQMYILPHNNPQPVVYQTKPEMAPSKMHPSIQYQHQHQQYISQMPSLAPSQSNNNNSNNIAASAGAINYGYDYSHQMQDQVYYAQPPPSQYQTMTSTSAVMLSHEPSTHLPPPDNTGQH
ncbi:hypothetical protein ABFS82_04G136600 [Erythranthe guttata]|uniref:uncharacterized protein LOC105976388 n=1 Tax=Erythranthe guttata TaxID=4155 RepID=UPI00064DFDD0|nr:PREDICTED: uncharacterized protein LOC105976388 [Erythranthe guttata]|eukprot:XP_012857121.1 PREDICTED: uncharacterized protein LOC105976388 [Erythranthe guttata]